jgi:A/G-specific adenine glycosylase
VKQETMRRSCQECKIFILDGLQGGKGCGMMADWKKCPMQQLKEWFLDHQRDLPWRQSRTSYRVWISEIMLQQTQVAVVIPYFHRWMQKFPTLRDLAAAPLEEIIKAWEGLGYYSRARNLHKAAQMVVRDFGGELPSTYEELDKLPGFGPYTIGAVLSFAFQQKAAAVDGNVVRVLSRFFASDKEQSQRKHYEALALSVLPDDRPWVAMEGLIELGAQICQRRPKCAECPLRNECRAYREGKTDLFPLKKKRPATVYLERRVAVIRWKDEILVRQEKEGKVMAGLYEFPYTSQESVSIDLPMKKLKDLPLVKHGFTRYDVTLYPAIYEAQDKNMVDGFEWKKWEDLELLPFSSGHRRILELLKNEYFTH